MKPLLAYLPQAEQSTVLIQGRVDANTVDKAKIIMRARSLTWSQVLDACLKHFVDELGGDHDQSQTEKTKSE